MKYLRPLLLVLFLLPLHLSAQPSHPWPSQDALWEVHEHEDGDFTGQGSVYHLNGDTLYQGKTYQKIHEQWIGATGWWYYAATREDSGRVYILPRDSTTESLIMDFNAQPGDLLTNVLTGAFALPNVRDTVEVVSRGTIQMLDGPHLELRVRLYNSASPNGYTESWVAGVGCMGHPFYAWYQWSNWNLVLLECMKNQNVLVKSGPECIVLANESPLNSQLNVHPNPVSEAMYIEAPAGVEVSELVLRDLNGREIASWDELPDRVNMAAFPAGIYLLHFRIGDRIKAQKVLKY